MIFVTFFSFRITTCKKSIGFIINKSLSTFKKTHKIIPILTESQNMCQGHNMSNNLLN